MVQNVAPITVNMIYIYIYNNMYSQGQSYFQGQELEHFLRQISMETESQSCMWGCGGRRVVLMPRRGKARHPVRGGMCKQMLPVSWDPRVK